VGAQLSEPTRERAERPEARAVRRLRPASTGLPARDGPPELRADQREALAAARHAVEFAADKKASDIVLLEVGALTTVADYFVICSGASERQLGAIADGIAEGLRGDGVTLLAREGEPSSHWLLLDFGALVVHVMAPTERDHYQLERLWSEAPMLLRVQ
jgi:ribosome-associated protein